MSNDIATIITQRGITPEIVEAERKAGYPNIDPQHANIAIEFVLAGATQKSLAKKYDMTLAAIVNIMANPFIRAFIMDLQSELLKTRLINAAWVEQQILNEWPKLIGEEPVPIVNMKDGYSFEAKRYHAPEIVSVLKHFGGTADKAGKGGVQVNINFGRMGVGDRAPPIDSITVTENAMGGGEEE